MPLSRITNYVDGNVLTGAQLNNEFDNILNNGPALVSASIPGVSIVQGLQGNFDTNLASFQANGYQLKSTSTIASLTATSSYSINTQTAGPIAGGRDQVGAFASTDIHFYAITTGGTSTNARGICSSTPPPTGPTLPAGYSAWAYLCSVKYDTPSSGMSLSTAACIRGAKVYIAAPSASVSAAIGSVTSANSLKTYVPTIASLMELSVAARGVYASTGGNLDLSQSVSADANAAIIPYQSVAIVSSSTSPPPPWQNYQVLTLPNIQTTPTVYLSNVITLGTSANLTATLISYSVPNGG